MTAEPHRYFFVHMMKTFAKQRLGTGNRARGEAAAVIR
jgi:hypothetical protein